MILNIIKKKDVLDHELSDMPLILNLNWMKWRMKLMTYFVSFILLWI